MNKERVGYFTSSQIYRLMSKGRGNWSLENIGKPFKTYIQEKLREYRIGRPITTDTGGKATRWGELMEQWVYENKFDVLDTDLVSKTRYKHDHLLWSGAPDIIEEDAVCDIKNPWTLTSFCDIVDSLKEGLEAFKKEKPDYYWQLVSNACLTNKDKIEMIIHMPYEDEVDKIIDYASESMNKNFAFIHWSTKDELPYITKGRYYDSLNRFRFEVPEQDKKDLESRIEMASETLLSKIEKEN